MSEQKFAANEFFEFANGAIGWRPSGPGPFDCIGPFAKVQNCPVRGVDRRYTCYATNYADTMFSVPAVTKIQGKRVTGFFTVDDGNVEFVPHVNQLP